MGRKVIRGLAVADSSCVRSVPLLGVVAEIGLEGEPGEREQRRNDGRLVQGMVRMEALHPAAMPDDVVAQLQVIVMPRRLIAERKEQKNRNARARTRRLNEPIKDRARELIN